MRKLNDQGVSEVFGTLFMIMIFLTLIAAMTTTGNRILENHEKQIEEQIEEIIEDAIINAFNQTIPTFEYTNQTITITIPFNAQNQTLTQHIK